MPKPATETASAGGVGEGAGLGRGRGEQCLEGPERSVRDQKGRHKLEGGKATPEMGLLIVFLKVTLQNHTLTFQCLSWPPALSELVSNNTPIAPGLLAVPPAG